MSGKLTRILGLKYAPELRFYPFSQVYKTRFSVEDSKFEDPENSQSDEEGEDEEDSLSAKKDSEELQIFKPIIPRRHAKRKANQKSQEELDNILKDD